MEKIGSVSYTNQARGQEVIYQGVHRGVWGKTRKEKEEVRTKPLEERRLEKKKSRKTPRRREEREV